MSNFATGYIYSEEVINENVEALQSMGVDLSGSVFAGCCERKIKSGINYENIRDFEAEYLASTGQQTGRKINSAGVLETYFQRTGICVGCGYSDATFEAWCARYVTAGDVPPPKVVSLCGPYLLGRGNLRGDNGAYPSYSASGYHNVGTLTVESLCKLLGFDHRTFDASDQEDIAIKYRNNFKFTQPYIDEMVGLKGRVYKPANLWAAADCLANYYPVTIGMGYQISETNSSGNGISGWYGLNGGHETFLDGWFTLKGRLGFLKRESWGKFPASYWPENRITIQTDNGPKKLYPGQGACWADDLWTRRPEPWALGYPTSNS